MAPARGTSPSHHDSDGSFMSKSDRARGGSGCESDISLGLDVVYVPCRRARGCAGHKRRGRPGVRPGGKRTRGVGGVTGPGGVGSTGMGDASGSLSNASARGVCSGTAPSFHDSDSGRSRSDRHSGRCTSDSDSEPELTLDSLYLPGRRTRGRTGRGRPSVRRQHPQYHSHRYPHQHPQYHSL